MANTPWVLKRWCNNGTRCSLLHRRSLTEQLGEIWLPSVGGERETGGGRDPLQAHSSLFEPWMLVQKGYSFHSGNPCLETCMWTFRDTRGRAAGRRQTNPIKEKETQLFPFCLSNFLFTTRMCIFEGWGGGRGELIKFIARTGRGVGEILPCF